MLFLVIFQFVQQSLQMYSVTKQWQINRYMNLLVKQGILYFFATFCFSLINVLAASGKLPAEGWQVIPLYILEVVPMYTLAPRFIMGLRKVHARDVQGRRGSRIDTAFGRGVDGATVMFADIGRNDGLVSVEETPMATRATRR
ncbi:hypothetical protein HD554DRAFT_288472 [Boletus coccyginus]|nr:hypothetical protein HD554DRAFT_288472 [Boletus coccyginus]